MRGRGRVDTLTDGWMCCAHVRTDSGIVLQTLGEAIIGTH